MFDINNLIFDEMCIFLRKLFDVDCGILNRRFDFNVMKCFFSRVSEVFTCQIPCNLTYLTLSTLLEVRFLIIPTPRRQLPSRVNTPYTVLSPCGSPTALQQLTQSIIDSLVQDSWFVTQDQLLISTDHRNPKRCRITISPLLVVLRSLIPITYIGIGADKFL